MAKEVGVFVLEQSGGVSTGKYRQGNGALIFLTPKIPQCNITQHSGTNERPKPPLRVQQMSNRRSLAIKPSPARWCVFRLVLAKC